MTTALSTSDLDLRERYEALLSASPETSGEVALHAAYAIGREALNAGLGVLDLAGIHRRVLTRLMAARPAHAGPMVDRVTRLFLESLVPFEMTHQGFRDANSALRASEERYRELFENANDIVFSTDLDGQLTSVNRAGVMVTGYSPEEALTLNIASVVAPEDARILQALARLRRGATDDGRTAAQAGDHRPRRPAHPARGQLACRLRARPADWHPGHRAGHHRPEAGGIGPAPSQPATGGEGAADRARAARRSRTASRVGLSSCRGDRG